MVLRIVAVIVLAGAVARAEDVKPDAAKIWSQRCQVCHGEGGKGDGVAAQGLKPAPPNFTQAEFWKTHSKEKVRNVITNGEPGTAMVAFNKLLSSAEIDALVDYVSSLAPK